MVFEFLLVENEIMLKLVISSMLGLLIGLERQIHGKPAGMRTLALVCMGATLFTIVSISFTGTSDTSRIAGGIVSGIGFLGAGAIFKAERHVQGMTTAAELWIIAAIGIAVGIGLYVTAIGVSVLVLVIIIGGRIVEGQMEPVITKHRKKRRESSVNKD